MITPTPFCLHDLPISFPLCGSVLSLDVVEVARMYFGMFECCREADFFSWTVHLVTVKTDKS